MLHYGVFNNMFTSSARAKVPCAAHNWVKGCDNVVACVIHCFAERICLLCHRRRSEGASCAGSMRSQALADAQCSRRQGTSQHFHLQHG